MDAKSSTSGSERNRKQGKETYRGAVFEWCTGANSPDSVQASARLWHAGDGDPLDRREDGDAARDVAQVRRSGANATAGNACELARLRELEREVLVHRLAIYDPPYLLTLGRPCAIGLHFICHDPHIAGLAPWNAPMLGPPPPKKSPGHHCLGRKRWAARLAPFSLDAKVRTTWNGPPAWTSVLRVAVNRAAVDG
jgi:hypothetical protein